MGDQQVVGRALVVTVRMPTYANGSISSSQLGMRGVGVVYVCKGLFH